MKHKPAAEIEADVDPTTGEILPPADDVQVNDAPDFDPELGTLMGDTRDAMLQRIRTLQKPWVQMSEAEQMDCANGVELAAKDIIRKTVRLLNQHEWPHAVVELVEMKIGGTKILEDMIEAAGREFVFDAYRRRLIDHVAQLKKGAA